MSRQHPKPATTHSGLLGKVLVAIATMVGLTLFAVSFARLSATEHPAPEPIVITDADPDPAESPGSSAIISSRLRPATELLPHANPDGLMLRSHVALILDRRDGVPLYERNADEPRPIASLTKIMTALVVLNAGLPLDEWITLTQADKDRIKGTRSRLPFGAVLSRHDLLHAALAASDNRAAAALARTYPGGRAAMIVAMNLMAERLGMAQTRFTDPAGLGRGNISTARDLIKLIDALRSHPLIERLSTSGEFLLTDRARHRSYSFRNTNYLVRRDTWDIGISKTGYTRDAGNCLLMTVNIADRPLTIVLLNSWGKLSKFGDSNRIRDWLLRTELRALSAAIDQSG